MATSMTDGNFPVDALERATVEVQLGANTYTWTQPGERACRALLGKVLPMINQHGDLSDPKNVAGALSVLDDAQDFLYDTLGIPQEERAALDDTATTAQIGEGLKGISEKLQRPFVGLPTSTDTVIQVAP